MTAQATIGEFDGSTDRARDTNDELGRILNMDEAVDELADIQVIDAWVRGQFVHKILRGKGPRFMHTDEFDEIEKLLKDATGSGLKQVAIMAAGRHSDLSQALGWEDGPGNVRTLFDRWTKDDVKNPVQGARENLKAGVRGCGMARIEIYRHRIKTHREHPNELTEA